MSLEDDFALALAIQNESDHQCFRKPDTVKKIKPPEKSSLADPDWELLDPTPDIVAMFIAFDMKFFWGKLKSVVIRWSKRMYSCAGICSYAGRCGLCTISLSEPLLKLRPRKDLVETLLHEMIHAYLFVTHNNKDRSGHGPEFHKHMYRINAEAGVNITVYHSFHDEVNHYKNHWWRCNGPCRSRAPYFGTVKRSSNRAPGPKDLWWGEHMRSCGGTWEKVKEPDNVRKKQVMPVKNTNIHQIGSFKKYNGNQGLKSNNAGTLVITKPTQTVKTSTTDKKTNQNLITSYIKTNNNKNDNSIIKPFNNKTGNLANVRGFSNLSTDSCTASKTNKTLNDNTGNLVNVKGFKDLNSESTSELLTNKIIPFSGAGNNLSKTTKNSPLTEDDIKQTLRNHWQNKFKTTDPEKSGSVKKRRKPDNFDNNVAIKIQKTINEENKNTIKGNPIILIEDEDDFCVHVNCPVCGIKINENDINLHLDDCIEKDINPNKDLDLEFSKDFVSDTNISNDFIKCPLCNISLEHDDLPSHLESCIKIDFGIELTNNIYKKDFEVDNFKNAGHFSDNVSMLQNTKDIKQEDSKKNIEYVQDINEDYWNTSVNTQSHEITDNNDDESYLGDLITNDEIPDNFPCPSCFKTVKLSEMNEHLDSCLNAF